MMKKSLNNITEIITQRRNVLYSLLLILLLPFIIMGSNSGVEAESDLVKKVDYIAHPISNLFENEPVLSLLGSDFTEITQVLGEPDEKGYSEAFGPHQYILYEYDKGFIRFSSPESLENKIAVSIILGPGQKVLGATVGMHFQEIVDIAGTPEFGPEIGIDGLYYMNYFHGEINDQMPEIFISFVSESIDSTTDYAFIKLEHFKLKEILLQAESVTER